MDFSECSVYIFSENDTSAFLDRLQKDQLTDEDKKFMAEIFISYQSFFKDFVFGKMSKKQFKKQIEKLIKEHGDKLPDIGNGETPPPSKDDGETHESQEEKASSETVGDDKAASGTSDINSDGSKPNGHKGKDSAGRSKPDPEARDNHGRLSANDFANVFDVFHGIGGLKSGCQCPLCIKGKLYPYKPGLALIMRSLPPVVPERHTIEKLRCNACQEIFSAVSADELTRNTIGRYSPEAVASLACHRYGYGMPFYRLETLGSQFDVMLSDSSMWDAVRRGAEMLTPLLERYFSEAANGDVVLGDDAGARVIQHTMSIKAEKEAAELGGKDPNKVRSGVHTTCFVVDTGQGELIIYDTGLHHTGEAFSELMQRRTTGDPLVFMSDASSCNNVGMPDGAPESEISAVNCLQHARDRFVKQRSNFPEECEVILGLISQVFAVDRATREAEMNSAARLRYHQERSTPLMDELKNYCQSLFDDRKIEPNGSLGPAIRYLTNHWTGLTGFLRVEGAPLHNNSAEFSLKTPKRHLKNSLAYLSERGADVGDLYMSLIATARRYDIEPFSYISKCLAYSDELETDPEAFLPWKFKATVKHLDDQEQIPFYGIDHRTLPKIRHTHEATWADTDGPMN